MKLTDIEHLVGRLERSSIDHCELEQNGARLVLRFERKSPVGQTDLKGGAESLSPVSIPDAACPAADIIRAPAAGVFYPVHPLTEGPSRSTGDSLGIGDQVGYLRVGAVLSAVCAQQPGTLGACLVENGNIVGYGEPLFEFQKVREAP